MMGIHLMAAGSAAAVAGVFCVLWKAERAKRGAAQAKVAQLALENRVQHEELTALHEILTTFDGGIAARVEEHAELALALQQHAMPLVHAAPGLATYMNRNNQLHQALLKVTFQQRTG
jgi:hypothetical protein